ncbi:hypothetical protein Tco_1547923 [Tanacetum coccineum]
MPRTSSDQLADNLHDVMMEMLPSLVKEKVTEQVKKEVPAQVRDQVPVYLAEGLILERKTTKEETERLISKAILQELQKCRDIRYEAYVIWKESSHGQVNVEEPGPSTSVTQDIMEEISLTIDEAKLKKMTDEMQRQRYGLVSDVITEELRGAVQTRTSTHSFNHYTDAKDIWENVKMILDGSELTKDDRESQLYDEFETLPSQIKGETIQGYYVRFT